MLATKSPTLCILLYLGFVTADTNIVFEKNETLSDDMRFESVNIDNSLLTAVGCSLSNSESTQKCKIFHTAMDSKSKPSYCEFELDKNLYDIGGCPLTTNKAIWISSTEENSEKLYIKFAIVDFHDCKTTETKLEFESYNSMINNIVENINTVSVNDDATFDILYHDAKLCGDKICRLTIDAQGNKVIVPITSFVPLVNAARITQKIPSSQGFVVTELKPDEAYKISLIKSDGQVVLNQFKTYDDVKDHDLSTSHGIIRLCSKTNTTKVDCELFDYSGKMMSKMSVDAKQKVESVTVNNLANNEFLLLTNVERDSTMMKLGTNGSIVGVVKLRRFACEEYHEHLESYVDVSNNQYCVIKACAAPTNLRMIKECFGDDEFH